MTDKITLAEVDREINRICDIMAEQLTTAHKLFDLTVERLEGQVRENPEIEEAATTLIKTNVQKLIESFT